MAPSRKTHSEVEEHSYTNGGSTPSSENNTQHQGQKLDAIIVGGGFNGVYLLKKLVDYGYKVLLVEAGSDFGGTWYWNRFPGARVDTAFPHYQFSNTELWKDWNFTQRFPGSAEIRAYFDFMTKKWDLRKYARFDTFIEKAVWDDGAGIWTLTAKDGTAFKTKYFISCMGCLTKQYVPDWKGTDKYKGIFMHSASWPNEDPNVNGKKIGIIGTGATAVQLIQELSKVASQLTVFQRTPNTALPMGQINYDANKKPMSESEVLTAFAGRADSFAGFDFNFIPRKTLEDSAEKRKETFEQLWKEGDFKFWLAAYSDMLFSQDANTEAYNFWRDKTRARIRDANTAELLAPMKQLHPFGTKRIPLENGYFEVFNEPHVKLIDINRTPIVEMTERGLRTTSEELEFDMIISATGFDSFTGSLMAIEIRGKDGQLLSERWRDGVKTHLGMAMHGFPNMLMSYGPQSPSPFCNGPACAEMQGSWIADVLNFMRDGGHDRLEPTEAAEKKWKAMIVAQVNASLLPEAKSWYMGDNIPGKPREPLMYLGGVPAYRDTLHMAKEKGMEGFVLSKA